MKTYIQYLDISPVTGNLYEPCGDRAVVILDGRGNLSAWIQDAKDCNGVRRPNYPHFKIMQGLDGYFRKETVLYSTIN
jgi:hypothetical protein